MQDEIFDRLKDALADRYAVEREIGRGGMASVYLATDLRHDRRVAIKVLLPELAAVIGRERFISEIRTTARLQHPNVLPLLDSGEVDGLLYYVMPFVSGESLADRIERERQLPVDDAVGIAKSVAGALDYAHRNGIIHRDIKPSNILLQDGQPVVSDFGIALAVSAAGGSRLTETGLSLGTPRYMSPEQASGDVEPGPATDVYALGCVLYEMLAGEPPFDGSTTPAILARILTEHARLPSTHRPAIPAHVEAAALTALEKVPADRFATAAAFANALDDTARRHPRQEGEGQPGARAGSRSWMTHPASRAAAAAVVVLLIMVGALLVRSVEAVPEPTPVRVALAQERWGSPAISNDGTLIADRPTDEGPIRIRRLEDGRTVDVPARGDGAPLAFSPDGRMLLFFDEAGMKRVPVDGGAPIEVLEVYPGGGATWGEDGTIVYSGLDGLYALDDEGGDPVRLLDRGYMSVASPRFLPGGSHLVFTRWGADVPSGAEIVVLDRASGELTPLVEDAASPHFVWPDVLLFGRPGRGLYGVAFDPDATTVLGEPVLLLDSVAVDVAAAGFQASRNGVMLAVIGEQIDTETAAELVMVTPGGTARPLGLRVTPPAAARISPDGTRIAYPAADGGAYIHELSIGRATPVEAYEGPFFIPSWHASSDSIVFTNMSAGAFEMLAVPVDGGPAREMFAGLGRSFALGWSPDGSRILFQTAQAGGTDFDLGVVERDPEPVPAPYLDAPWVEALGALSPDGRWVAYNGADDGDIHLQLRSFPQPGPAYPLGSGPVSGPLMVVQPRWAADMGGVFWQSDAGIMMTPVTLEPTVTVGEPILYLEGTFAPGFDVDAQGRVLVAQRTAALGSGTAEPRPDRPRWRYELFVNWRDRIREMVHQGG